jgi:hypothetical protein
MALANPRPALLPSKTMNFLCSVTMGGGGTPTFGNGLGHAAAVISTGFARARHSIVASNSSSDTVAKLVA